MPKHLQYRLARLSLEYIDADAARRAQIEAIFDKELSKGE